MNQTLKNELDDSPMKTVQYLTILICFLMNFLDGMDIMIISYTAPAIAKSWNISPANLGIVFSSGLAGMTLGAIFLAPYADTFGRKSIMLIAAALMSSCIYLTSHATGINSLIMFRFLSGLGIGGMLVSTASLTAEYTPNRSRDFWVSSVIMGTPVGAVISGFASANVILHFGWQRVFELAGLFTFFAIPLIYFFLNESIDFYIKMQPANALKKINTVLKKLSLPVMESLPEKPQRQDLKVNVKSIIGSNYQKPTFQLWLSLFFAFSTFYFLSNWIPKLATNAGISIQSAILAGTIFNIGAIFGITTQGYFSLKFGLKKTIGIMMILTALLMLCFGFFIGSDFILLIYFLLGFGIQGGFVGLFAVAARLYPTGIRSTGVGWAVGVGRLGGIVGPIIGGILVTIGLNMTQSFWIFSIPTLLSGIITLRISSDDIS